MGINVEKLRKRQETEGPRDGFADDRFKPEFGDTLIGIAPPPDGIDDDLGPAVIIHENFDATKQYSSTYCLDNDNGAVWTRAFNDALQTRKSPPDLQPGCPLCGIIGGDTNLDPAFVDKLTTKVKYQFGLVVMGRIERGERVMAKRPQWKNWFSGPMARNAIMDEIIEAGRDITDPDNWTLIRFTKSKNQRTGFIEYSARLDRETDVSPIKMPKPVRAAMIKAQQPGGILDLWKCLANFAKSAGQIKAVIAGEDPDVANQIDDDIPQCFGDSESYDPQDREYCAPCELKERCKIECVKNGSKPEPELKPEPDPISKPKPSPKPEPNSEVTGEDADLLAEFERELAAAKGE